MAATADYTFFDYSEEYAKIAVSVYNREKEAKISFQRVVEAQNEFLSSGIVYYLTIEGTDLTSSCPKLYKVIFVQTGLRMFNYFKCAQLPCMIAPFACQGFCLLNDPLGNEEYEDPTENVPTQEILATKAELSKARPDLHLRMKLGALEVEVSFYSDGD